MRPFLAASRLVVVASVASSPPSLASAGERQCLAPDVAPCTLVLAGKEAPRMTGCHAAPWSDFVSWSTAEPFTDFDRNGSFETVFTIDLDPVRGCGCAHFRVALDDAPSRWVLNIGDSPTNKGWSGDIFTTGFAASVQIKDEQLHLFSAASRWNTPDQVNPDTLLLINLIPLAGRTLRFTICNQMFRLWLDGAQEPTLTVETEHSQRLFALNGQDRRPILGQGTVGDYRLFAAFNRAIHDRSGRPYRDRHGSGVSRVEITLTPDARPRPASVQRPLTTPSPPPRDQQER